jgi:collagenase-like protein with putative collagen-binding domain
MAIAAHGVLVAWVYGQSVGCGGSGGAASNDGGGSEGAAMDAAPGDATTDVSDSAAALDGAEGGADGGAGLPGPLKPSANPNYFQDATGRALLLAGSHTWNDLQDWGAAGTPEPFDFGAYTNFLVAHGHDFTLLWRTELPKFCGLASTSSNPPDFTTSLQPWPRTGPGTADDGGPKFDLSSFDPSYFSRLRSRVMQLNAAGVWAGVYLFTGEWLNVYRCAGDGYPLTGGNNVNSIDDGGGNGSMTMSSPNAITAIQDAMADKTVDTLNDLPNVLWIVSEEAAASTAWWQGHMIAHVRAYEAGKPLHHPIGLAMLTGDPDSTIYDSDADWVAPQVQISPTTTCGGGTPKCKVNVNDSDHSYFGMWNDTPQQNRQYAWENFARGNNVLFMDPYVVYYPRQNRNLCASPKNAICSGPDPRWDPFRDNLGYILSYSRRLNLNAVLPSTTLCSTAYCLAQTPAVGSEVLVYAPSGGTFTVDLSHAAGRTMNYEWFDPSSGKVVSMGSVPGGNGTQTFSTPGSIVGDSVLYLVDSAGHA